MFTTEEKRKLLKNTKLHWIIKANAVRSYIDSEGLDKASYDLGLSRKTVDEYWKLSKYMRFFPQLKEIPDKREALRVINYNEGNSIQMRKMIAVTAMRFKSKLVRSAITAKFRKED